MVLKKDANVKNAADSSEPFLLKYVMDMTFGLHSDYGGRL